MPEYWHNHKEIDKYNVNIELNKKIVAAKKPYFMTYVYPKLRTENNIYIKNNNRNAARRFNQYGIKNIEDLEKYENKTDAMIKYLDCYHRKMPIGNNPCVVNRISWIFEKAFSRPISFQKSDFDYSILKKGVDYSKDDYKKISNLYKEYSRHMERIRIDSWFTRKDSLWEEKENLKEFFQSECARICPNEDELCDILIDLCYTKEKSKQFVWDICGNKIVQNLLGKNENKIQYPQITSDDSDFTYCGKQFIMHQKEMELN